MAAEFHVAGVVVHALPGFLPPVRRALRRLPGAQIHGASPAGKLVVTLEASCSRAVVDRLAAIQRLDGVLSAVMVYQHSEAEEEGR